MKITKAFACVLLLMFAGGCTFGAAGIENALHLMPASILLLLFVFPIIAAVERNLYPKKNPAKSIRPDKHREIFEEYAAKKRETRRKAETITSTVLLGTGTVRHTRYGLSGAAAGAFFGGIAGFLVGPWIPKDGKRSLRFLVKYEDGHTEIKDVLPDSSDCEKYLKLLEQQSHDIF